MKSLQRESDGQDSLMVQRPIEMVSNQDIVWAATVCGPLRRNGSDWKMAI